MYRRHWAEVCGLRCRTHQWRCQLVGTSQKAEQQDVLVRKQEANCQDPWPVSRSEINERYVRSVGGSYDIDQKHAIGKYKFTLTSRALCAPDGSILPCTDKSKLVHSLWKLCKHTSMAMVSGVVEVWPIWRALGRDKATASPVFHAFTGADNVGRFSGVGKTKWFQHYINAERNIVKALMKLPEDDDLTQEVKVILASFVCLSYCQKGIQIAGIPDLRWYLFCKHLAESNKLSPATGALEEHIERVRVQSRVWCQATVMWQQLFDPLKHSYHQDDKGHISPPKYYQHHRLLSS